MVEATAASIAELWDLNTLELMNCSHLTNECLLPISYLPGRPENFSVVHFHRRSRITRLASPHPGMNHLESRPVRHQ